MIDACYRVRLISHPFHKRSTNPNNGLVFFLTAESPPLLPLECCFSGLLQYGAGGSTSRAHKLFGDDDEQNLKHDGLEVRVD